MQGRDGNMAGRPAPAAGAPLEGVSWPFAAIGIDVFNRGTLLAEGLLPGFESVAVYMSDGSSD